MTEETDSSGDSGEEKKNGKRLTLEDWREIEIHWQYDTLGTKDIATQFGISTSAVTAHFAKRPHLGKRGSKSHLNKARQASLASNPAPTATPVAQSAFEEKRKDRIEKTKEQTYWSAEVNFVVLSRIQKELLAGTRTPESYKEACKVIRTLGTTLKENMETRYKVLDIENDINEQDLPVLVFEDLTITEIAKIQNGTDEDPDSLDLPEPPDELEDDIVEEGNPGDE